MLDKNTNQPKGVVSFANFREEMRYSFIQYIESGLEISLITCIDFTASNLDPKHPKSLHFQRVGVPNQYQRAIQSVGSILLNYDHDKIVPVYGFGAKTFFPKLNNNQVSHFFPCSGDFLNTSGLGIQGCFDLYQFAINHTQLSGPTKFSPLLSEINTFTENKARMDPSTYSVLLILTDGIIHDMVETIGEVVRASRNPLSIIIIGVGNENFSMMEQLDSDDRVTYNVLTLEISG